MMILHQKLLLLSLIFSCFILLISAEAVESDSDKFFKKLAKKVQQNAKKATPKKGLSSLLKQVIKSPKNGKKANFAKLFANLGKKIADIAKNAVPPKRSLDDRSIWNKYRTRLAYEVAKRFCNGKTECDYVKKTEFQLITTPMNAKWHQDKNQLNKDVVGFAPAWSISYKPITTSLDGVFSEIYKKYLLQSKNLSQYKVFMQQQPQRNDVFYDWEETSTKLEDFVKQSASKKNRSFSFKVKMDTNENLKNSWATLGGGYEGDKSFIRAFTSKDAPLTDNEMLADHFDAQSDSQFLWSGDRTVYHDVYQTKTIVIKTRRFDFTMSADALGTISVKPGKEWFDKEEFVNNAQARKDAGMFGPNGKMPLLPASIIVAFKPKVEIIVSKSVYEEIQNQIKDTAVLGWLVGGAKFTKPQIRKLNDGLFEKKSDEIYFEKIEDDNSEKVIKNLPESDLEAFLDQNSEKADSDWIFGWGGRTNHVTRKHVVEKKVNEGNYKVTWVSNSDVPQILGVVSERL